MNIFRCTYSRPILQAGILSSAPSRCKGRTSNLPPEYRGQYLPKLTSVQLDEHRRSRLSNPHTLPSSDETSSQPRTGESQLFTPREYRYVFPEFLPKAGEADEFRDRLLDSLIRRDMMRRRLQIDIPEFYVGSILAVTLADRYASTAGAGRSRRFVGLCIRRSGTGLHHRFALRNMVDGEGVEVEYELYSPLLLRVEVLRLERRLDDDLSYLIDAPPEYSTVPMDMQPVPHPAGAPVPLNPLKVPMKPLPWFRRWELLDLKGVTNIDEHLNWARRYLKPRSARPLDRFDLMSPVRSRVSDAEVENIYVEVARDYEEVKKFRNRSDKR